MAAVTIEGVVDHGRRLGRELGSPTANVAVPDSVTAADGVYYSRAEVDGTLYDAMSNLGKMCIRDRCGRGGAHFPDRTARVLPARRVVG